eukprot:g2778.t1
MQVSSFLMRTVLIAAIFSACAALTCTGNSKRIVGLNTWPGDIGLSQKNRGCESWCQMHELDSKRDKTEADAERAISESDFLVVDGWRGFIEPHYRFVAVDELMGGDRDGKVKRAPKDKIAVSSNMDPYDLAGKRLFQMAPFLNITIAYSMKASVTTTFAKQDFWQTASRLPVLPPGKREGHLVWVSSNCRPGATYGRDRVVERLMKLEPKLDSRGGCMNNKPRFPGNYGMGLETGYASYKFALVMENSIEIDWVTEKFFLPFLANTVPVYYGAPNIEKYAPGPHSFINMRNFDSPEALIARLKYLADPAHEDEYLAYFAWRKTQKSVPPSLARVQRKSMYRSNVACDVCNCICNPTCRNSAKKLLDYPHIPQLTPWQAPTQAEINAGLSGYFVPCSGGGCDGTETEHSTQAPSAVDLWDGTTAHSEL